MHVQIERFVFAKDADFVLMNKFNLISINIPIVLKKCYETIGEI